MYEIKFKFHQDEARDAQKSEIEMIHELSEITEVMDWDLPDIITYNWDWSLPNSIYSDEWTDGNNALYFVGDILEVLDPQTGETATIRNPYKIKKFLDWDLTDIYIFEWTDGEDILGLFS